MTVADAMTRDVRAASPDQPIPEAARAMADLDTGVLPVGRDDSIIGMITDRDIAIRGVAEGKGPDTPVRDVMLPDVRSCFEDEDVVDVARTMAQAQVGRLPVMSRNNKLVGIISLGDVAVMESPEAAAAALSGISEPRGEHSQTGGPNLNPEVRDD
jgi:CBS domain-containing protein